MESLISVVLIDNLANIGSLVKQGKPGSFSLEGAFLGTKEGLDLNSIRTTMGGMWVPAYLPDGCELSGTATTPAHSFRLHFSSSRSRSHLIIVESPKAIRLRVLRGMHAEVTVRGTQGFIVNGAATTDKAGHREWSDNICRMLMWEMAGWSIRLEGLPAERWPAEELIRVAESMTPF